MAGDLTAAGVRHGSSGDAWRGFDVAAKGNHWKFTIENLEGLDAEAVKRLARERSVSMAAVIRDAVDEYVRRESGVSLDAHWQRSLAAVGGFHSGRSDLSQTRDDEFAAAASE
jgi:predicted transcriptional regulator